MRPLLVLLLLAACVPEASAKGTRKANETKDTKDNPMLAAHNAKRAQHCAPALEWSDDLAAVAQRWADKLGKSCALQHSGGDYGENLAAGTAEIMTPEAAVDMWYGEAKSYKYKSGGFSMKTGHFTQLVWLESKRLGCGSSTCKGLRIWVCNYDPPGNVDGEYRANVLPTSCKR